MGPQPHISYGRGSSELGHWGGGGLHLPSISPSSPPGSLQASGERLHAEPLPGPLGPACPVYQYQYSPPMAHPMCHGFDEWQQIRYPPAMPSEHTPGQNFHHFPPVSVYLCQHKGPTQAVPPGPLNHQAGS